MSPPSACRRNPYAPPLHTYRNRPSALLPQYHTCLPMCSGPTRPPRSFTVDPMPYGSHWSVRSPVFLVTATPHDPLPAGLRRLRRLLGHPGNQGAKLSPLVGILLLVVGGLLLGLMLGQLGAHLGGHRLAAAGAGAVALPVGRVGAAACYQVDDLV